MRRTVKIMGIAIDALNMEEAYNRFISFMNGNDLKIIYTPNTEIIMASQNDLALFKILNEADLVIPDGIGIIYASKILGKGLRERVTGVDLMLKMLQFCNNNNKSIFILGGKPGVGELAAKNIQSKFLNIEIKGIKDGYFNDDKEAEIIREINDLAPDILFVALGAPKQEKWIYKYRKELRAKVAIGVGGGVDIWAGTAKRAPYIFQKLGLEWFYRLIKEPFRYKRMMSLPRFMIKTVKLALSRRNDI